MSNRYQGGILGAGFNPLRAPNAPTIGTATKSVSSASVAFTAPACVGGSAITSYAVRANCGIGGSGTSSPVTVTGLTNCVAYTFTVSAINSYGPSPYSAASNSVTPNITSQTAYTTAGTYSFVVPACITSVAVVAVGAGGGGGGTNGACTRGSGAGGALAYTNSISTTPGETLTVTVGAGGPGGANGADGTAGGQSALQRSATYLVRAGGGGGGTTTTCAPVGGTVLVGTGGAGGAGVGRQGSNGPGAGGAGGYSGAGGAGSTTTAGNSGTACSGAGGGGAVGNISTLGGGGGGGVGLLGKGTTGAGGTGTGGGGLGGSGGANGSSAVCGADAGAAGGLYGGGGGGANDDGAAGGGGGGGAVRIIYPGTTRSFPSTNTGDL